MLNISAFFELGDPRVTIFCIDSRITIIVVFFSLTRPAKTFDGPLLVKEEMSKVYVRDIEVQKLYGIDWIKKLAEVHSLRSAKKLSLLHHVRHEFLVALLGERLHSHQVFRFQKEKDDGDDVPASTERILNGELFDKFTDVIGSNIVI